MKENRFNLPLIVLIIIGIVVLINIISMNFFFRIDTTEGKVYSLSKASKKIVKNLDDNLIVKAFFTEDLPPQLKGIPRLVKDYLDEYKAFSNGNFQYEFIDPSESEDFEKEANEYRIPPVQVQVIDNDQISVKKVHLGLVVLYEDKKEIIPVIQSQNISTFEYDLTSLIKKITSDELPVVGFLDGFGSPGKRALQTTIQLLKQQYDIRHIEVKDGEFISDKIKTLLVVSPKDSLDEWTKFAIDQFIMKGGKVGFFIDKVNVELQEQKAELKDINIDNLLESYGVKINNDLIGDAHCSSIGVIQQQGFFSIQNQIKYPFIPSVTNFNKSNVIVKNIENLEFWAMSSLDTSYASKAGINIEILASTSDKTFSQTGRFDVSVKDFESYNFNKSAQPLVALLSGSFKSAYKNKDNFEGKKVEKQSVENRIIVVGDGDFMQEGKATSMTSFKQSLQFFQNLVDWLTTDEDLITIRSKEITTRPLEEVSDSMRKAIKALNILLLPSIILIIGIIKWQIRKRKKSYSI